MRIKVESLGEEISKKAGKGFYKTFKVNYTSDGQARSKDLVSFEKEVYDAIKNSSVGDQFDIALVKNGNFWNWKEAKKVVGEEAAPAAKGTSYQSNARFETPEERALRQVYIIRQSSLAQAVAYSGLLGEDDRDLDTILNIADTFTQYVLNGRDGGDSDASAGTLVE